MLKDVLTYAKERSPVPFILVLSGVLFASGFTGLELPVVLLAQGWATLFLLLFMIRLSDDICDIPIDSITHPERVLCSGAVSLVRINRFRVLAVVLMLALNITQPAALVMVAASIVALAVFFWLKPRLPTLVHVALLNFLLFLFPVYSGLLLEGAITPFHLGMGLFIFLGALAHDFSHSLLDIRDIPPDRLAPLNRFNQRRLAWLSLALFLISAACGALLVGPWSGWGFAGCLALMVVIMLYLQARLIRHPSAETAKPFYIFGFLFFLLPILGHVVDLALR